MVVCHALLSVPSLEGSGFLGGIRGEVFSHADRDWETGAFSKMPAKMWILLPSPGICLLLPYMLAACPVLQFSGKREKWEMPLGCLRGKPNSLNLNVWENRHGKAPMPFKKISLLSQRPHMYKAAVSF